MWLIKVACRPKCGRSEDWLESAAAVDPQQEKGGKGSTAMQAMRCNVMCDDGVEQRNCQCKWE